MKATETTLARLAEKAGAMTFLAWTFIVGLGGFILMCGVAYAIVTENLALGIACGVLLIAPCVLGLFWILTAGASLVEETRAQEAALGESDVVSRTTSQRPLLASGKSASHD